MEIRVNQNVGNINAKQKGSWSGVNWPQISSLMLQNINF